MLSVSVVLSVSVEGAMECRMRVNEMICAVSSSGTMRSLTVAVHKKTELDTELVLSSFTKV